MGRLRGGRSSPHRGGSGRSAAASSITSGHLALSLRGRAVRVFGLRPGEGQERKSPTGDGLHRLRDGGTCDAGRATGPGGHGRPRDLSGPLSCLQPPRRSPSAAGWRVRHHPAGAAAWCRLSHRRHATKAVTSIAMAEIAASQRIPRDVIACLQLLRSPTLSAAGDAGPAQRRASRSWRTRRQERQCSTASAGRP
jgi:hypothetical protein